MSTVSPAVVPAVTVAARPRHLIYSGLAPAADEVLRAILNTGRSIDDLPVLYETQKTRVAGCHTQVLDARCRGEKYILHNVTTGTCMPYPKRLPAEELSHRPEMWDDLLIKAEERLANAMALGEIARSISDPTRVVRHSA